jgi:hypothetical protein
MNRSKLHDTTAIIDESSVYDSKRSANDSSLLFSESKEKRSSPSKDEKYSIDELPDFDKKEEVKAHYYHNGSFYLGTYVN